MVNKSNRKTINTVICVLIAAMLVSVVLISAFTVASRRSEGTPVTVDAVSRSTEPTEGTAVTQKQPSEASKPSENTANAVPETTERPEAETRDIKDKPSDALPTAAAIRYYVVPVSGTVSNAYQVDVPVYSLTMNDYRAHTGVDFSAPLGSEVAAVCSGTVCRIWDDPMMGKCVSVDHGDSIVSTYMNLDGEIASGIEVGSKVKQGQPIGSIGETALVEVAEEPHVHLEMRVNGKLVDPIEYMGIEVSAVMYGE